MGKEKPLISVIVPVYNAEPYLERCLDSIVSQSYSDIEILFVNDASTDQSGQICDARAAKDGRIQVIHFSKNRGPSAARNEGIRVAKGTFAAFVDADDYVEADLLEKLYGNLLKTGAKVSACGAWGIEHRGGSARSYFQTEALRCLARCAPFPWTPWGKLYAMELVKKTPFDERIFYSEDILFLYQLFKQTDKICYLPDRLYHYSCREGGQVHSGVDEKKCTALCVHDAICKDIALNCPCLLPDFQQMALNVNRELAVMAVKANKADKQIFLYLRRIQKNIRRNFSWKALLLLSKKKQAAVLVLYISTAAFRRIAAIYTCVKRLKGGYVGKWRNGTRETNHQRNCTGV